MHSKQSWLGFLAIITCCCFAAGQERPRKKIIEYGWDVPTPDVVRKEIRGMEKRPFDGIIFRLGDWPNFGHAFDTRPWDKEKLQSQLEDLKAIKWQKFTDNFICLYAADDWKMDWFNDEHWKTITANLRLAAEAARAGRCVGVCFDPEPYGPNPWAYPEDQANPTRRVSYADRTFSEVYRQVRRRGAQFIQALQEEMADLRLFTFYHVGYFGWLLDEPDPGRRRQLLEKERYGLLVPFLNGVLDAAGPKVRIIDGGAGASNFYSSGQFYRAYHRSHQLALSLIVPENRAKYAAQVQCSPKLFVDLIFAVYPPVSRNFTYFMSPSQRQQLFEQNVYYSLVTTDEYVWCYSERMNWWRRRSSGSATRDAAEAAIRSARTKYDRGEPLGFDLEKIALEAKRKKEATIAARKMRRSATIHRLRSDQKPPRIDGVLDDAAWNKRTAMEAFVTTATSPDDAPRAATRTWVTYDRKMLYVAFRCEEPSMNKLRIRGTQKDSDVWAGDSVDLFLSLTEAPEPNRHFIVNPGNVQWDGDGPLPRWNGNWQSAAKTGKDHWAVELAIPWELLGALPKPGSSRRANLCRHRRPYAEWSTWSTVENDFLNPDELGVWKFEK